MQIQRSGLGVAHVQNRTAKTLGKTSRALNKILERLATAQRINRASDDAAGLSISEQLRSQVRGFKMATRNVSDAMSALNITDGAAGEIENILQRQRELTLQAKNGTLTDDQRQALDVEFQQLQTEIDRIAESTEFNTQEAANGEGLSDGDAEIQAGANAGDTVELPPMDMTLDALGTEGASIATLSEADDALARIDSALDTLHGQRSSVGAMVNRFESTINNLQVAEVNTQAAESVLRDQDMASGLAALTRNQLLSEGGIAAFSRFNEISANHLLSLLG